MKGHLFLLIIAGLLVCGSASCQSRTDTVQVGQHKYTITTRINDSVRIKREFPAPLGYVSDFERLLTPEQRQILEKTIEEFEVKASVEIAIVTIDTSMTDKVEFDRYTLELANRWGIGKKDKDNGILIGFSTGLRKIRIQNGLGIEKLMTDEDTKLILDSVVIPKLREADYFSGLSAGLNAIIEHLSKKLQLTVKKP